MDVNKITAPNRRQRRKAGWRRKSSGLLACSVLIGTSAAGIAAAASTSGASTRVPTAMQEAIHPACKAGATPLTFWGWAPGYDLVVNAFNKSHPSICVTLEDNGAAINEYTKLDAAVKAGVGAPDIAEIEYLEVPSFEITNSLLNLVPYGINAYKKDIVPFAWSQVSQGPAVYSMAGDIGPLAMNYNATLLNKYHITPPATWTQFATDAATLHKDDPSAYLTDFTADPQWILALMQAWGAFPFVYSGGTHVTVNFTGPTQMAFANYWQKLLSAGVVNHVTDFNPTFWHDLDNEVDGSWLDAAWSPADMAANLTKTVGDWRVSGLPQVTAGGTTAGSWGGSTWAVMKESKHPKQAAEFVEWYGGTMASWKILNSPAAGAFPSYKPLLDSTTLKNGTIPLSGSSKPNLIYTAAAAHVETTNWPPFMTEVLTEAGSIFAGVLNGTESVPAAMKQLQSVVVKYAQSQGFKVTQ